MKSPVTKTLGYILYEIYSYAAAGVLGFFIGIMVGSTIFFGLGLQQPNRNPPVWFELIEWPIVVVPIVLCMVGRFVLTKRRSRQE